MQSLRWKSLVVLALAFGIVEAALVSVYRGLLDPQGLAFPLIVLPPELLRLEQIRELATILLLGAAASLVASRRETAFAAFLLAFGLWDLVYYAALRLFVGWPTGWGDWDLLFLAPLPWLAPVWAPILVALVMVVTGSLALRHVCRRGPFRVAPLHALAAAVGGALCIASFVRDAAGRRLESVPERYAAETLLAGLALGVAAFAHAWWRNRRQTVAPRRNA